MLCYVISNIMFITLTLKNPNYTLKKDYILELYIFLSVFPVLRPIVNTL
jgi:hypothetical protein